MIRVKQASHGAKANLGRDMAEACAAPTKEMFQWQMHAMAREAVDDIAPRHLNKKGRIGWAAREFGAGYDRVRKAYHQSVKCIEVAEFVSWTERFARLLAKGELHLEQRLEQHRQKLEQWKTSRTSDSAFAAAGLGHVPGLAGRARGVAGGLGEAQAR